MSRINSIFESEETQHRNMLCYNDLKVLVSLVEARTGRFPTPVLNEMRNALDHVMRAIQSDMGVDGETKKNLAFDNSNRILSHLQRATLDCYKILILECLDDLKTLEKNSPGLRRIDKYVKEKFDLIDTIKNTRKGDPTTPEALGNFSKAYEKAETLIGAVPRYLPYELDKSGSNSIAAYSLPLIAIVSSVISCVLTIIALKMF